MGLLIAIVVGAIVGWLASIVMKTNAQMGSIFNIVVGIVGAWIGNALAGLLGLAVTSTILSIVVAIAGACILIAILKTVGVLK
ncbi:MAG: GlsB/YeaQ/YmgE family stress response membrane protein [Acidobacteria bacterium]|nr:GlsB/YeaQ/YmgE family stress response membrane protein [Acidobacteriota bacterium]HQZ40880.1 GlsB/YeaQ/YmgE family stress response membrane protein [Vicinamibacterales bacterium]